MSRYLRCLLILIAIVVLLAILEIMVPLQLFPLVRVPIVQKYFENTSTLIQNYSSVIATSELQSEIKCKRHRPDKAGSEQILKHYGQPGRVEDRKCDETNYPDICSFHVTESGDNKLSCDAKVCGSTDAEIGSLNPEMGKALSGKGGSDWKPLPKEAMTATVEEAVKTNLEKGFTFLFIRCGSNFQVLTFPPILKKIEDGKSRRDISINVIVLDSISRPHFYRILPRAVEAFSKINQDPNIKATVMDFELVQSIGQQTFENVRPFFSGVLKDDNEISTSGENMKAPVGVDVMYGTFQKWGYQTLFQEDLCWYDTWGIMLTALQIRSLPSGDSEFKARWKEFQETVAKKNIDHFGLSHFSCTVVNKLGRTNYYDYPEKVCFNGQFFTWYFIDYITKVYTALKNDEKAKPLLSYLHLNTGHETNGKRIVNMDAKLAKFFIDMVAFPDTLTVIFSDHGHTRTPFSSTEEGRRELFDPLFFMIVPDGVAERLGPQRMAALVANQKRLFFLQDVHKAFMSLNDPEKMSSQNFSETGIFSVIPANRTCADLHLLPLTRCKCEGFDDEGHIKDNAENQKWLAEFALGTLNDAIQKQYMGGKTSDSAKMYGYGNCERLVGKSFTNVIKRFQGEFIITTMDLQVVPPTGYKEDEVYKVSLKQYAQPKQGVTFLSFIRQTKYSKFEACTDKSVDIKLCGCAKEQTTDGTKKGVLFESGVPREMFGTETIVKNLDSNCLLLLRRSFGTLSFALEVANVCTDRTYKFELTSGTMDQRIFATTVPIRRELHPKTFYFLTSVFKYVSKVDLPLNMKVSFQVKSEGSSEFKSLGRVDVL